MKMKIITAHERSTRSELSTCPCMTGDRAGQRGTFERQRETYLSLPRISFNIKDMVEEKAS
jgi:hypothetical protein